MNKWIGKIAVVTGASAGIGAALVKDLARSGVITIGLARRSERVEALKTELGDKAGNLHARECDISNENTVKSTFNWIEEKFGGVNILVNNAGCVTTQMILETNLDPMNDIRRVIDTNLYGFLYSTREAFKIMNKSDDQAYIVNVGSIAGHGVPILPGVPPIMNVYAGTKHSMTATSEVLRQELNYLKKNNVRITQISPGAVATEIGLASGSDLSKFPKEFLEQPSLTSEDVSDAILYVLGTPSRVQIKDIIIKPNGEFV